MEPDTWTYHFLIELWLEPREIAGLPRLVRGRVRDIEHSEEKYVKSFREIEAFIDEGLERGGHPDRRWEGEE